MQMAFIILQRAKLFQSKGIYTSYVRLDLEEILEENLHLRC